MGSLDKRLIRAVIFGDLGGSMEREMISADVQECKPVLSDYYTEEDNVAFCHEDENSTGESSGEGGENGEARRTTKDSKRRKRMNDLKRSVNVRWILQRDENDLNQLNNYVKLVDVQRRVKRKAKECVMECLSFITAW